MSKKNEDLYRIKEQGVLSFCHFQIETTSIEQCKNFFNIVFPQLSTPKPIKNQPGKLHWVCNFKIMQKRTNSSTLLLVQK